MKTRRSWSPILRIRREERKDSEKWSLTVATATSERLSPPALIYDLLCTHISINNINSHHYDDVLTDYVGNKQYCINYTLNFIASMKDYDNHPVELNTHRTEMLILAILVLSPSFSTYPPGAASSVPTIISSSSSSPISIWSARKTKSPS